MKQYTNNDYYSEESNYTEVFIQEDYGCRFCWDNRAKKEKELLFFDPANNLRICKFCPWCGREYLTGEE